jgi:hypothetical protein
MYKFAMILSMAAIQGRGNMGNNIQWALDAIAATDQAPPGYVAATVEVLRAAGQLVVVINDGVEPIMLSVDPEFERIYLINDFLAPDDHQVPWALRLREVHYGNEDSIWGNPLCRGILLILLIMGNGLNNSGMILEISVYEESSSFYLHQRVLDQSGVECGKLQILANNVLLIDAPVNIQIIALQAFLAARDW